MANSRSGGKDSVHYFKEGEQAERWRREFVQKKEYEVNLAAVSKLSYDEVDYQPMMKSEEFPPLVLNNYDQLYVQAAQAVEAEYFIPIAIRTALFFVLGIVLIIFFSTTILGITAVLSGVLAASLLHTRKKREKALEKANEMAAAEIRRRHDEETTVYQEAKKNYENAEHERLESIKNLLEGQKSAIGSRLIEAFKLMKLPVLVEVEIEFYNNVPLVKVWLPPKMVIPQQNCEMLPSGRVQYKDKEVLVYNKQYFELIAAIVIQVVLVVLGNVPSFQCCYALGLVKEAVEEECLITVRSDRENAVYAGRVGSVFNAFQFMEANYEADTVFALKKVQPVRPEEWGDVEQQDIYSIKVKIFK